MKIELKDYIDIKAILTSGACFRYTLEEDGSITNILTDRVINIKQDNKLLTIKSSNYDNLENIIYEYFDLNRDYNSINKEIINNNKELKNMVNKCSDYRILNQEPFEMCISYIISQNNNVKRISKSIEVLCNKYGNKVLFEGKEYCLFPRYQDIKNITIDCLNDLKIGFRDKYIIDFLNKYEELKDINILSTEEALKELMKVKGIGMKVASCILLFGYKRLDVYPIDTWVKQYISENYNIKNDQKTIENFARSKYGKYTGLVIQYMFHSQRNTKDE